MMSLLAKLFALAFLVLVRPEIAVTMILTAAAAAAAICTAIFAGLLWWTTRKTKAHDYLQNLLVEYRSAEMLHAVRRLWDFHEKYGKSATLLKNMYQQIYNKEYKKVESASGTTQIEEEKITLHNQRRIVSQFYTHLALQYSSNVLPKKQVFQFWSSMDLEIIPNVLIPLEEKAEEICRSKVSTRKYRELLQQLYDESVQYNNDT